MGSMIEASEIDFYTAEESRYERHQLIGWWDQKKLSATKVIVAGAGALGNEVLKLLALIGVGHITVIDFDIISRSNLARMILFREADIGRSKIDVAVERLHEINPDVLVRGIHGDLRFDLGLGDFREANIVFGCLDSVNARWALNRKCMQAGVDWIDGGISDHHGLVAHYSPYSGACYECNFTPSTIERFNKRYSCPFGLASDEAEEKVPTTAITTSVIAGIQVQQALLILHGKNDEALKSGERLMILMKPFRMLIDKLPENQECLAHDYLPQEIPMIAGSNDLIAGDAIRHAKYYKPDINMLSLPFDFVTQFCCPGCGSIEVVNRPKEKVNQSESRCPECKQMREPVMITELGEMDMEAGLTLKEIGIPPYEILKFRSNLEEYVYLQIQ